MDNRGAFGPDAFENHSLNNPTRIKLVSNKPKVYLLYIRETALRPPRVDGVYSSQENAESEVESGEHFAILEVEIDSVPDTKKLAFSVMEKSE